MFDDGLDPFESIERRIDGNPFAEALLQECFEVCAARLIGVSGSVPTLGRSRSGRAGRKQRRMYKKE